MKPVHVLAGLVAGAVVGYGAGYLVAQRQTAATAAAPPELQQDSSRAQEERESSAAGFASSAATSASSATEVGQNDSRAFTDQLRDIAAIKSDVKCTYEAERLFESLALAELPGAFAAVQALPASASRSRMLGMLFRHWGSLDGPAALAATDRLSAREKWNAESKALEGWSRTNPEAAWNVAREKISANPTASWRLGGALREFSRVDLSRAMGEASENSSEYGRQALRGAVIDAAAEDGRLELLVNRAMQFENQTSREAWIKDAFSRWGSLDTDAPMTALRNITDPTLAQSAMTGFMGGWSELDPRGAFDYVLENRTDPLVSKALSPVIGSAVRYADEAEVRAMMSTVVERGAYGEVVNEVGPQIAQHYPTLALELASALTDQNQRTRQTSMALSMWSRNDFASAAAYFEAMPTTPDKISAFYAMSSQAMRQAEGPASVARWIEGFSGQERMRAVQSLIANHANQPAPLRPEGKAALARVIAATPGLQPEALERAKNLFGTAPAP